MSKRVDRAVKALVLGAVMATSGVGGVGLALAQGGGEDAAYRAGTGLLNRGLHELAAAEFEKFLREQPGHEKALTAAYALGVCMSRLGRHEAAAGYLERASESKGFEFAPDAMLLRGEGAMAMGDEAAAARWFERVVKEYGASGSAESATVLLGEVRYRLGETEAARGVLDGFVKKWPGSTGRARAELFLALCEASDGEYASAAGRLKAMRSGASDVALKAQATLIEAQCRQRAGEAKEALTLYESAAGSGEEAVVAEALLGVGQLKRAAGDLKGAARVLDELLGKYGREPAAMTGRIERGRVYLTEGQAGAAKRVMMEGPALPVALRDDAALWLARCEAAAGEHGEAVARLREAIEAYPTSVLVAEMRYDLARALSAGGDDDGAIEAYATLKREHPGHALTREALRGAASIEYRRGAYERAAAACREVLAGATAGESNGDVELMLGESEYMRGAYEDAARAYAVFIERQPGDAFVGHAKARRGVALARAGRFADAEALLNEAASVRDGNGIEAGVKRAAIRALADEYFAQSRWDKAAEWLGVLVAGDPASEGRDVTMLRRGLALQRVGRREDAEAAFESLLRDYPKSEFVTQARFERGQSLYELGRLDDASEMFEQVLAAGDSAGTKGRANPAEAAGAKEISYGLHAARYLATIATKQGRSADAARFYERAGVMPGGDEMAGDLLYEQGAALVNAGEFKEAERVLGSFIKAHDGHARRAEAVGLRGIALSRLGDAEGALKELERALAGPGDLSTALRESIEYEWAWTLGALKRNEEALAAYAQVLSEAKSMTIRAHASVERARLLVAKEEYERALLDLRVASESTGHEGTGADAGVSEQVWYLRGASELRLGRIGPAIEALTRYVEGYPSSRLRVSGLVLLGEARMKEGRVKEAVIALKEAVNAAESAEGSAEESAGSSDETARAEARAGALLRLGEATAAAHDWVESEEAFTRYLSAYSGDELAFQARFGIGWAREHQGRHEAAIESYREVVSMHKGVTAARAQFQIGECLYAMKRYDEAARELIKTDILFAYPEWSAAALYEAGRCLSDMGKSPEAKKQFEEVVSRFGGTQWGVLSAERLKAMAPDSLPGRTEKAATKRE